MAAPEAVPCPRCGSTDTKTFPDGSGACGACGRAFRGAGAVGTLLAGEQVEVQKAAVARGAIRLGLTGILGGVLAFLSIPAIFLVGAALAGAPASLYIGDVFNRPSGALACGGISLLVVFGWYALWAGFQVWRGSRERGIHLLVAGGLVVVASLMAGQGIPGALGIVGGLLALIGGLVVWRAARAAEEAEKAARIAGMA